MAFRPLDAAPPERDILGITPMAGEFYQTVQETKKMKKLFAAMLLMAIVTAIGCSEKKTTKPTTTPSAGTSAPADKTMPAAEGEKK